MRTPNAGGRLHTVKVIYATCKRTTVQFSRSVVSDSLRPHPLQHTRPPCASPAPGGYLWAESPLVPWLVLVGQRSSNSCPLSRWCHPTISSSVVPFSARLQSFPASGKMLFSNESARCIRWPKYWSFCFNISRSNEYSGLISFRMDWLDLCSSRDSQESSPTPQVRTKRYHIFHCSGWSVPLDYHTVSLPSLIYCYSLLGRCFRTLIMIVPV